MTGRVPWPSPFPVYEGRSTRPAVMIFCMWDQLKSWRSWNSGLEDSPVQQAPSLKLGEHCRTGGRKTESRDGRKGCSVSCSRPGTAVAITDSQRLQLPAPALHETVNNHLHVGKWLLRSYPHFWTVSCWYLVKRGTIVFHWVPTVSGHQSPGVGSKCLQMALP